MLRTNADDWALMRAGQMPAAKHSKDGYLARLEADKRERAGERIEHTAGAWTAHEYPTGRLAVQCPQYGIDIEDFRTVPHARVFELAAHHAEVLTLLRAAGWSVA